MDVNFKSVIFGFLLVAGEWLAPLKRHAVRRILNRNIRLRSYNFRNLVLVIAGVDGCTRLEATSSAQSFDSHSNYPFQDYDRYNQRIKLHNHEFQDKRKVNSFCAATWTGAGSSVRQTTARWSCGRKIDSTSRYVTTQCESTVATAVRKTASKFLPKKYTKNWLYRHLNCCRPVSS